MPLPEKILESCRSWSPYGFVTLYEILQRDYPFPQHLWPLALAICDWRCHRLMMICGPGSGKSTVTSQVFPGATLGRNPAENILCISGAEQLASGFQDVIGSYIIEHEGFRQLFPTVLPDKQRGWSSERGIFVTGHRASSPDASFSAFGVKSKVLTGKHGTILILDDLHTEENSSTDEQCDELSRTFVKSLAGRQDPRGARIIITGRRWNERDLYGRLKDNGNYVVLTLPYERPGSKRLWYDITVPEGKECVFTDGKCIGPDGSETKLGPEILQTVEKTMRTSRLQQIPQQDGTFVALRHLEWLYGIDPKGEGFFWPEMDAKREEYFDGKRLEPETTEAVYQCNPGARHGAVFLLSDFDRRYQPAENQYLGIQIPEVAELCRADGSTVVQAWDTAFSAESTSDHSVCATLLLTPCNHYHRDEDPERFGPCEQHFDISILDIWRGRVGYAEVERQMRAMYHTWQPAVVLVENKAYGVTAIENLQNSGMPIEAVKVGPLESKRARAVEGVSGGSVQGWCRSWRVRVPTEAPWLEAFLREMTSFTGTKGGTDDQVDALVHGVRWAIRNGGGADLPSEWANAARVDEIMRQGMPVDAVANMVAGFQGLAFDPFGNCCGRCQYFVGLIREKNLPQKVESNTKPRDWCMLHNRPTQAIGSCDDHMEPDGLTSHPFWS